MTTPPSDDELRASEQRYRRIVEETSEGVVTLDLRGRFTFVNRGMARLLGYTVEAMIGQPLTKFLANPEKPAVRTKMGTLMGGGSTECRVACVHASGSIVWGLLRSVPLHDDDGKIEGILAMVTDITARWVDEEARARLAAVVQASNDAIYSVDFGDRILSWNGGAERLFGYSAAEMEGRSIEVLIPPADRAEYERRKALMREGVPSYRATTERLHRDGTAIAVSLSVSPMRDASGVVTGSAVIARDVRDVLRAEAAHRALTAALRQTEDQLRHAQKMEAVGRLAGGIAHDLNNVLSVVLSYSSFLEDVGRPVEEVHADVDEIRGAAERAANLTRQLLAISRQQALAPKVIDPNAAIADLERMTRRIVGEDVEIALTLGAVGRICVDRGQLDQVVLNLVINARDAMSEGGKIGITTSDVSVGVDAAGGLGLQPGRYVVVAVSDTGTGMDDATRQRIFEPFFTTKEVGKGTGLGLSTVFGIVGQSGGAVSVDSALGRGSEFRVYLPRTDDDVVVPDVTPAGAAPRTGRPETVLVVEDDASVRQVAVTILRRAGYVVIEATSVGDALLTGEQHVGPLDLLVTDIVMPKMNGRELAMRLTALRPDLRVLLLSGYTDDVVGELGARDLPFLQKPITPEALASKVREVLDNPLAVVA